MYDFPIYIIKCWPRYIWYVDDTAILNVHETPLVATQYSQDLIFLLERLLEC